jgi:CHASE2 domain
MTGRRPRKTRPTFGWYFLRGAAWVGVALSLTLLLHGTQLVQGYERANLDSIATLVRLGEPSDRVAVVMITEGDYKTLFGGQSPLKSDVIKKLIVSIRQAGAAVVGVDVLTEEWPYEDIAAIEKEAGIPIVWLGDVVIDGGSVKQQREREDKRKPWKCRGPSVLHKPSGVVREYDPRVGFADGGSALSFTRLIETVYQDHSIHACDDPPPGLPERQLVPFPRGRHQPHRFPASVVLDGFDDTDWQRNRLMDGQIVLLGGAFEASRDYHATPFEGRAYGVDIQAGVIAADLAHQQIDPTAWWVFLVFDVALGLSLVAAGWFFGFPSILAITAGAVVLVFGGSLLLYQHFQIYLSFVPVLAGVSMHFLVEHLREHWKLRQQAVTLAENRRSPARQSVGVRRRGRRT